MSLNKGSRSSVLRGQRQESGEDSLSRMVTAGFKHCLVTEKLADLYGINCVTLDESADLRNCGTQ